MVNCTLLQNIPDEQRAKDLKELNLDRDKLPVDRALDLKWCFETVSFNLKMELPKKTLY